MKIIFNAEKHKYIADGVELPSVSEIVRYYHNVDLSNIPAKTLKMAGNRGTNIHNDIEKILKGEKFVSDYVFEIANFLDFRKKEKIKATKIEEIVYGATEFGDYCGTFDFYDEKTKTLYDIKTNYEPHIELWTSQLNLYKYAMEQMDIKVKKMKIIYLPKETSPNKPQIYDILAYSQEKVLDIVKCFFNQEKPKAEVVELKSLPQTMIKQLSLGFQTIKRIEDEIEEIKKRILAEMKQRNITNFSCEDFTISFVPEYERKSFDSKRFKENFPDVANEYIKVSKVADSIKISLKEQK